MNRGVRVLVTGVGGPAGRSLCAQLLERGFDVLGADMVPVAVPGVEVRWVPAADDDGFLDVLTEIMERQHVALLIPTVTEELVMLAGRDLGMPVVVVGPERAVRAANDKWLTCRRLAAAGVAVPRFALPSEEQAAIETVGVPHLSKPRVGRGGRGVAVHPVSSPEAIELFDDSTLLQEFIPGTEYAPNLYLAVDRHDDVVVVLEKTALAHERASSAARTCSKSAAADRGDHVDPRVR